MYTKASVAALCLCLLPAVPCATAEEQPSAAQVSSAQPLGPEQLDQLTAPIALYPDTVLAQILAAATYPLEVFEAARWLDDPTHTALRGAELETALAQQSWDLSVKSLVPFPELVHMMATDLDWTERLGDAFLAQQADVMESIQRLRKNATAAGNLYSTPEQSVTTEGEDVTIQPTNPDVFYTPYYNPWIVYGSWPWSAYPPVYLPPPPGFWVTGPGIIFGTGLVVLAPLCCWSYWPGHTLQLAPRVPRTSPLRPGTWTHDPNHRLGAPYPGSTALRGPIGTIGGAPPRSAPIGGATRPVVPRPGAIGLPWEQRPAPSPVPVMPAVPVVPRVAHPGAPARAAAPAPHGAASSSSSSAAPAAPAAHGGGVHR
jgi:hypothetical protein